MILRPRVQHHPRLQEQLQTMTVVVMRQSCLKLSSMGASRWGLQS